MKVLILRFSSFGDVTQCLSVPTQLKVAFPEAEIHWTVRSDLAELLEGHPAIAKIWPLHRAQGVWGLLALAAELRQQGFTHLYDAHNNLRSFLLSFLLRFPGWPRLHFIRKSQKRWKRFLLFRLHRDTYEKPRSGQRDLLEPLTTWGVSKTLPPVPQLFISKSASKKAQHKISWPSKSYVALAPSSAFPLKRWPMDSWSQLISMFPNEKFILLGGPEDSFLKRLAEEYPNQVLNLAGKLSLLESAAAIQGSRTLVANDTGLLHVAEQLGCPTIALIGTGSFWLSLSTADPNSRTRFSLSTL